MATLAELLAEARERLAQDLVDGVEHTSTDGTSVTIMDALDRLEAINELEETASGKNNSLGVKMVALNAPMGGGRP